MKPFKYANTSQRSRCIGRNFPLDKPVKSVTEFLKPQTSVYLQAVACEQRIVYARWLRDYFVASVNEVGYMLSSAEKNVRASCNLQFNDCQKC